MLVKIENASYAVPQNDRFMGKKNWLRDHHVKEVHDVFSHVPRGGTMLDVGACTGVSCVTAVLAGYADRAIAFEPDTGNYELLRQTVELNGLEDKIRTVQSAITDHFGARMLSRPSPDNCGSSMLGKDGDPVSTQPITSYLTDDVSLVWVDAQGSEPEILKGAGEKAKNFPWYLEIEFPFLELNGTLEDFPDIIKAAGFSTWRQMSKGTEHGPIKTFSDQYAEWLEKWRQNPRFFKMVNVVFQ